MNQAGEHGVALVTGVGRKIGIAAAIAAELVEDGWKVATAGWRQYDERMTWESEDPIAHFESDFEDPEGPGQLIRKVNEDFGAIGAIVLAHAESVDSDIHTTTVESFNRHMAVNARGNWLLIREFADQFSGAAGTGRIVALTSDHTVGNLPYGASKGAMDRIVLAAAVELAHRGITANVVNPGATDTGWITPEIEDAILLHNLQTRIGQPEDCARLVRFLLSDDGGWINGQLIHSDGGKQP